MSEKRTVTVTGTGSVSVRPDTVQVELTLEAKNEDHDAAVGLADRRVEALQTALEAASFPREALRTTSFHVRAEYDGVHENGVYRRVFQGYACVYGLRLRFPLTAERISAALSAISESGAMPEISIGFTVREPEALRDQVLADAARKARSSAETLCAAAGAALGPLLRISYTRSEPSVCSPTRFAMANDCAAPRVKCAAAESEPENVELTEAVLFTWELA